MSGEYRAECLRPGLYAIDEGMVRSFLAVGDARALLVDTGCCGGDIRGFCGTLTALPIDVVNTHADGDHIAGNGQFQTVYLLERELPRYIASGGDAAAVTPISDGHVFALGSYTLETRWLPGHTPGSIVLIEHEKRFLFAGDMAADGHPVFLVGEGRSIPQYIESLKALESLDGIETVYASHGPVTLKPGIFSVLREAAERYEQGLLEGRRPDVGFPAPGKIYSYQNVMLLAD